MDNGNQDILSVILEKLKNVGGAGGGGGDFGSLFNWGNNAPATQGQDLVGGIGNLAGLNAATGNGQGVATPGQPGGFLSMDNLFGNKGSTGLIPGLATGAANLAGAWTGLEQLDLAKETFDFNKGAFNRNMSNQAKTINSQLEDRQRARIGSTGNNNANGTYESLDSYKKRHSVDGSSI